MGEFRKKYDQDFMNNTVELSYVSHKTVKGIADELGIKENLLYNQRIKYTADGDKTKYTMLEEENRDIRRQLAKVEMESDM